MDLLSKWLKKLNVGSYYELNEEEKATYRDYENALSGRKLTDDEVINFLKQELEVSVSRLTDVDLKPEDAIFRKVEVRFIKKILNFINSPQVAKEFAEKAVEQMIKN